MPTASTFTNMIKSDTSLVSGKRLIKPSYVVKFTAREENWFTVWDGHTIKRYNNEKCNAIAMRPYIDELFQPQLRDMIISQFDTRSFLYKDLITFKLFQKNLELLKPRK